MVCQGCQKNQKDLIFLTLVCFCANIQPKWNKLNKNRQNQQKWLKYAGFLVRWRALNCVFNLVHYHYLELSELADHLVNEINTCRTTIKLTKW